MASDAAELHRDALVVDTHVHGEGFVPRWAALPYRAALHTTMPPDVGLDVMGPAGVDAVVAKAVGDGIVTNLWLRSGWGAVVAQLERVRAQCEDAGGVVALDAGAVRTAARERRPAVVLGVEGADVIGTDVAGVDHLCDFGVRVVGLVHLVDNAIG